MHMIEYKQFFLFLWHIVIKSINGENKSQWKSFRYYRKDLNTIYFQGSINISFFIWNTSMILALSLFDSWN